MTVQKFTAIVLNVLKTFFLANKLINIMVGFIFHFSLLKKKFLLSNLNVHQLHLKSNVKPDNHK